MILFALFVWYMHMVVNPVIVQTSEAKVKSITQHTLATSVLNVVQTSNSLDDLIHYNYDTSGKIALISVNSYDANILARQISSVAQTQLDSVTSTGIEVHLGAFTGIALFASSGPLVRVNLNPIGTVVVKFKSEFISAGINQTLHKIFIDVQTSVYVVLPTSNPKIDATSEVLVTETVIVGEIPSTYLQSSYLDEMLNLVPT
ncbi:MAG: sporulation protein YunB [Clostridia bacterium]|nr:sporulation protein YunB [Clostridia bacterium]